MIDSQPITLEIGGKPPVYTWQAEELLMLEPIGMPQPKLLVMPDRLSDSALLKPREGFASRTCNHNVVILLWFGETADPANYCIVRTNQTTVRSPPRDGWVSLSRLTNANLSGSLGHAKARDWP